MEARKVMLGIHLGDTPNELSDTNFAAIAEKTEGWEAILHGPIAKVPGSDVG
jgi:hypothetical protein